MLGPFAAGASAAKTRVAVGVATLTGFNTPGTAQANCPRGTVAVSGGFGQTPAASIAGGHYVAVYDSHRFGARAWKVSGVQAQTGSSTLTAYAYCRAEKKPKELVKSFTLGAASRSEATAIATCPKGLRPISGGFKVPPLQVVAGTPPTISTTFVTDSEIFGKHQWVVTGVRSSNSAPAEGKVTAYGYCAKGARPKARRKTVTAISSLSPGNLVTADTSACAKGSKPISGGFRAPYTQVGPNRGVPVVTDSLLIGSAWRIAALPFGTDGIPISFTAIVYCR